MPAMDEQKFSSHVEKEKPSELYWLFGEEVFLVEEALKSLEAKALGDGLKDFNLTTFYGGDASPTDIQDAVETLPMMAEKRVVVVKEAQALKEKSLEALQDLVKEPVDSTTLIFVSSKVDKRRKFYKDFMKKGRVVEFRKPYENQIPAWVGYIAKKYELQMSESVAQWVHQIVGTNLLTIDNEMRKLSQYLGDRKNVELEDLKEVLSQSRLDNVFDLAEALGLKDRARALECLANLLDQGQNEVGALAMLTRHFRILSVLSAGQREGLRGTKLSAKAGVPPFFLKKYEEQTRRWPETKLRETYQAVLETDRALKSSPLASHIWLENLIIQVC